MGAAAQEIGGRQHQELRRGKDPPQARPAGGARHAGGGGRSRSAADQEAGRQQQRPHRQPNDKLRETPVVTRDQLGGDGGYRHRRDAHAGRDQRDGEAAVALEPGRDGGHQRREDAASAGANEHAEQKLELRHAAGAAGKH